MTYSGDEVYEDEITSGFSPRWGAGRERGPEALTGDVADSLVARLAERLRDRETTIAEVAEWCMNEWDDALLDCGIYEYADRWTDALADRVMARMLRNQVEGR